MPSDDLTTKQDLIYDIADAAGCPRRRLGPGSKEPKQSLVDVVEALHLPIETKQSKPRIAEAIARAGGEEWDETCDSRWTPSGGGSTVTREGLARVLTAVRRLTA